MTYQGKILKQIIAEEALEELRGPFTVEDMFTWVHERYPSFKKGSVRKHLYGMSANYPKKDSYHSSRSRWRDTLFKIDSRLYRRYNPHTDQPPELQS